MRIELEYGDGSIETFFANVPDGQRRLCAADKITLVSPNGERRVIKNRGGHTTPGATLREYELRCGPHRSGPRPS